MTGILDGQHNFIGGNLPIDVKRRIIPSYSALTLRMVEIVALILEDSLLTENGKAVGKALRDEELPVIFPGELAGHILSKPGRAPADIHRHIQHAAGNHPHQLALGAGPFLEMQPPQHAVSAFALVVLDKLDVPSNGLVKVPLAPAFHKIAPLISKHPGLENEKVWNGRFNYLYHMVAKILKNDESPKNISG